MLRIIGFLLVIAPCLDAFSLRHRLKSLKMSIWPYRLLLWQLVVLYVISAISKSMEEAWSSGDAMGRIFHHPHFMRFSREAADFLSVFSPLLSYWTLFAEGIWILLLIPRFVWRKLHLEAARVPVKLFILLNGIALHIGILIFMEVNVFSIIMMVAYCGLLLEEDFRFLHTIKRAIKN